jgi:hypothetical protein
MRSTGTFDHWLGKRPGGRTAAAGASATGGLDPRSASAKPADCAGALCDRLLAIVASHKLRHSALEAAPPSFGLREGDDLAGPA